MPMFKKDEPKEDVPPAIAGSDVRQAAPEVVNGNAEDKEGFQRILQMLGGTGIGQAATPTEQPVSPAPRQVSNGTKRQSRFTGFFDQTPTSPERLQSPQGNNLPPVPFKPVES